MTQQESSAAGRAIRAAGGMTVQWLVLYRYADEPQLVRARVLDVLPATAKFDVERMLERQSPQTLKETFATRVNDNLQDLLQVAS